MTFNIPELKRPKISMVIPCYTQNKKLEDFALWCATSFRDQVDELIIIEDGQMFSHKLANIADVYIYKAKNSGFTKNVNDGWKFAHGEYVMIANSDTQLASGRLDDLCIPGKVTSPIIRGQYIERLAGPFWVVPRTVAEERGYLIEELKTYSSDSEYDERVKDIFQKVESVEIHHEMAQSVTAAGIEGGLEQERDKQIYAQLKQQGKAK